MKPYGHLSQYERYQISALADIGTPISGIARTMARHASTIRRELQRNASQSGYEPEVAHSKAVTRQSQRHNAYQIADAHWALVYEYLRLGLSPQQISGRLWAEQKIAVSCESIYLRIYDNQRQAGDLIRYLRCQKARRKRYASGRERRGCLVGRVSIEQRPAVVERKTRLGDWEGDTVIGKGHQGVLVTLVERKSRYTLARRVHSKHAGPVGAAIIELLRPHKAYCHTMTFDNGKEFANHALIAYRLDAKVYFAHPYCSWERGLNENTNGLLRQYFPKETNLRLVTDAQVEDALYALNHRPRKCLAWKTPHEVFFGLKMKPIKLITDALCA
jgi:transposase, IS30 family